MSEEPTTPRALVTGAAGGIGSAIAAALLERGWAVVVSDCDPAALENAAAHVGPGAEVAALDVVDADAFAALAAERGPFDLLVNNAGTMAAGEVHDLSAEHWDRVIDVNLKGAINGIAACYPAMVERGSGHILNIASLLGLTTVPLVAPYATSKFGLVGLGLAMHPEARRHGVTITTVCPGIVETTLLDRATPDGLPASVSAPPMRSWTSLGMGRPLAPERLAVEVVKAIERRKAILVTPWRARLAWRLSRLAPAMALRLMELRLASSRR